MAAVVPKALQISNPFPAAPIPPPTTIRFLHKSQIPPPPRAAEDDSSPAPAPAPEEGTTAPGDSAFDNRLAQLRLKYRSGTGKKAEQRRAKKGGGSPAGKKKGGGVMLPPVPLREALSAGGMTVDFGFSPYSEWLNGRLAGLGLAALLLVELGSGKGLLAYHSPPIIFLQLYTIAAAAAVFVKYEKERVSVWPQKTPSSSAVAGD